MRPSCRTRLGLADDIKAIERFGDEGRLNGGRGEVADLLEGPEHGRGSGPWTGTRSRAPPQLVESINPPRI